MSTQKFSPLGDRVLVDEFSEKEKSKGGIYIPEIAREKITQGLVIAVGPGEYNNGVLTSAAVQEGDHVYFGKYVGVPIELNDKGYLIIKAADILGTITEED